MSFIDMSIASAGVRAAIVANEVSKAQKQQQQQQSIASTSSSSSDREQGDNNHSKTTKDGTSNSSSGVDDVGDGSNTKQQQQQQQRDGVDASMKEKYERLSGHMFTVMWYVTEIDIQSTLKAVCVKVIELS